MCEPVDFLGANHVAPCHNSNFTNKQGWCLGWKPVFGLDAGTLILTAIWVFSHLKIGRTNHMRSASFGQRLRLSKLLPLLITKDFLACASNLSFWIIWMKMTSVQTKKHMNTVDMYDEAPNTSNSPPQQQHKKPFSNPNELYLWV